MHEYGLHCYNPTDKVVVLINTVYGRNLFFFKRQINGAEQEKTLYAKLGYPSVQFLGGLFTAKNPRLYCDSPRYWYCTCNLGQKYYGFKRGYDKEEKKIHMEGDIVETPKDFIKIHKRGIYDSIHMICKWNTIFYLTKSQY